MQQQQEMINRGGEGGGRRGRGEGWEEGGEVGGEGVGGGLQADRGIDWEGDIGRQRRGQYTVFID